MPQTRAHTRLRPWLSAAWLVLFLGAGGAVLAGCAALAASEEQPRPGLFEPVWRPGAFREHLEIFNAEETGARATGTLGFARAASYVASRFKEFRLQPVLAEDYRVLYATSVNYPRTTLFWRPGPDSLLLVPGVDYLPLGTSDAGQVAIRRWVVNPGETPLQAGEAAVVTREPRPAELQALRARGAEVVFVLSDLYPELAPAPVRGLLAAQLSPATAALVAGVDSASVAGWASGETHRVELPSPLNLRVMTEFAAQGGAINVMGYVTGKHPALARELVVVCADLDDTGAFAGTETIDLERFGRGTAALLETARHFGYVSRLSPLPERSLLFAVWSGSALGHAGLKAFVEHPPWDRSQIRAVVYLSLDARRAEAVRAVLAPHGIPLIAVPSPADALGAERVVLAPHPVYRRALRDRQLPTGTPPGFDLKSVTRRAVDQAIQLAETAFPLVVREALGTGPYLPARQESLPVPELTLP